MVRAKLNSGCRYSTPVHERPLHPTRSHLTPEASQTQAPVTPATEPEQRAGGGLTTRTLLAEAVISVRVRAGPPSLLSRAGGDRSTVVASTQGYNLQKGQYSGKTLKLCALDKEGAHGLNGVFAATYYLCSVDKSNLVRSG